MAPVTIKAVALLALIPLALAAPPVWQKVKKRDLPSYCDPGDPYNANDMWYLDDSDICSSQGIGDSCCVTFSDGKSINSFLASAAKLHTSNAMHAALLYSGDSRYAQNPSPNSAEG